MNVALCLSGQMRTFDYQVAKETTFHFLLNKLQPDIFISTWSNRGVSAELKNLDCISPIIENNDYSSESITQDYLLNFYPNVKACQIIDFDSWLESIDADLSAKYKNETGRVYPNPNCIPILAQYLYCNNLKLDYEEKLQRKYDLVIVSRPDMYHKETIPFSSLDLNNLYNINPTNPPSAFHPNRIYSIFFFSNSENVDAMCGAFENIKSLFSDPFDNGLSKDDPNRLMFLQASKMNIPVVSLPAVVAQVYKHETFLQIFGTDAHSEIFV